MGNGGIGQHRDHDNSRRSSQEVRLERETITPDSATLSLSRVIRSIRDNLQKPEIKIELIFDRISTHRTGVRFFTRCQALTAIAQIVSDGTPIPDHLNLKSIFKKVFKDINNLLLQPREFSNAVWAASKLKITLNQKEIDGVVRDLKKIIDKLKPADLCNITIALVDMKVTDTQAFDSLYERAAVLCEQFNGIQVVNLLACLAKQHAKRAELVTSLVDRFLDLKIPSDPDVYPGIIRSLSELDYKDDTKISLLAEKVSANAKYFNPRNLLTLLHSFAQLNYKNSDFYTKLTNLIEADLALLPFRGLIMACQAMAQNEIAADKFLKIVTNLEWAQDDIKDSLILLDLYPKFQHPRSLLYKIKEIILTSDSTVPVKHLVTCAATMSEKGLRDPKYMTFLAEKVVDRLDELDNDALKALARSYSHLGIYHQKLYTKLQSIFIERYQANSISLEALAHFLWCSCANHPEIAKDTIDKLGGPFALNGLDFKSANQLHTAQIITGHSQAGSAPQEFYDAWKNQEHCSSNNFAEQEFLEVAEKVVNTLGPGWACERNAMVEGIEVDMLVTKKDTGKKYALEYDGNSFHFHDDKSYFGSDLIQGHLMKALGYTPMHFSHEEWRKHDDDYNYNFLRIALVKGDAKKVVSELDLSGSAVRVA